MTRLRGRMLLTPRDPGDWAQQIADQLPAVHAVEVQCPSIAEPIAVTAVDAPSWARDPSVWRDALAIAHCAAPSYEPCFVHGDYQHFNFMWFRQRLSGIVDWTFNGMGVPEKDVGHCELNLAIIWGAECAADFRRRYVSVASRAIDPYWELRAVLRFLPGWGDIIQTQAGRRLRVDTAGINGRVEKLVAMILRRC
jgi:Phosphotransferase enzyme family